MHYAIGIHNAESPVAPARSFLHIDEQAKKVRQAGSRTALEHFDGPALAEEGASPTEYIPQEGFRQRELLRIGPSLKSGDVSAVRLSYVEQR